MFMSKTLEKNFVKQKKKYLLRPWKELVIDLYHKYKTDVFFSTRAKIIFFHTISVVFVVLVTIGLIEYVQRITLSGVVESLHNALSNGSSTANIFTEVDSSIAFAQTVVYGGVVGMSILVGLIATWLALNPVRDSLITQRRFIASIAHELRTPLAILKTQNEVAKLDVDTACSVGETLDQNIEEIDHITAILNNLLLFNRVDTLESIIFDDVDLESVIETVISRLKTLAEKKGIVVTFERTVIPHVYGNVVGLEQMLFNLIKNGIHYTRRGGEVVIKPIEIAEREVTLRISDNGIGIAKNELPHIFEPFYRTDRVQEMSSGTGLGLALVFEIVKLHRGKIHVESTVGVGTQFIVSIPRLSQNMIRNHILHEGGIAYDFSQEKDIEKL